MTQTSTPPADFGRFESKSRYAIEQVRKELETTAQKPKGQPKPASQSVS